MGDGETSQKGLGVLGHFLFFVVVLADRVRMLPSPVFLLMSPGVSCVPSAGLTFVD